MNKYLLEFAIFALIRNKIKNGFVFIILSILVLFLSSFMIISSALKQEILSFTDLFPSIIAQKQKAMRNVEIDESIINEIVKIQGVESAEARVWGYYKYDYGIKTGVFSIVGIGEFEDNYRQTLNKIADEKSKIFDLNKSYMLVGEGVYELLKQDYHSKYFNFIKPDRSVKSVEILGVFKQDLGLYSNDIMLLSKDNAREILGMEKNKATDIFIQIPNEEEIATISLKIKSMFPDINIITKEDIIINFSNLFDYKSGFFLSLFSISLLTFFMIVFDKISGVRSEEKKEIAILRALGWKISDLIKEKFYESFIISFFAYLFGIFLAYIFIYVFDLSLFKDIFSGLRSDFSNDFSLPFIFDLQILSLIFVAIIPIYIAATIIPSWKIASFESQSVLR